MLNFELYGKTSNMSGSEDIVAHVSDMAHGPLVTFKVYFLSAI